MKISQKPLIIAGLILSIVIILGLCLFFFLQVTRQGEPPEKEGEFIGYVNEYTTLEKIGDNTYRATISSLPGITADGLEIKPIWKEDGESYMAEQNIFAVAVDGRDTEVEALYDIDGIIKKGQTSAWSPQVFLNGEEVQPVSDEPVLLAIDPINENYKENTLEWDYGICKRYLRLIEGAVFELYIFNENPNGDIEIKSNSQGDLEPAGYYAIDSNRIPVEGFRVEGDKKILSKESWDNIDYPVEVDDSFSSSPQGYIENSTFSYSATRNSTGLNYAYKSTDLEIGQSTLWWSEGKMYTIGRGYIYFDTRAIPNNATINSAYLRLNVMQVSFYNTSVNNFDLVVQNGQPTYPHMPLTYSDFYRGYYSGNGGSISTNIMHQNSWSNINLNSTGLGWINKGGYTKLVLRSSRDINGNAPTMALSINTISQELVRLSYYPPAVTFIVNYTVPSPIMTISQSSLTFGDVREGSSKDMNFSVSNIGVATLTGSVSGLSSPFSCVSNCNFSIEPSQSENVTLRFAPTSQGSFSDTAVFTSNGGNLNRSVSGNGTIAGCIPADTMDMNYTISSATLGGDTTCIIRTGNTEGVENGDIIIGSGITVQMEDNTELVFNDGRSIFINGTIAKTATNSVIKKGHLAGAGCTDDCSPLGSTGEQCSGNYVQTRTCGDYDADSCFEWSSWSNTTNCDSSDGCVGTTYRNYYCSGGSCTYSSSYNDSRCITCTNDCSYSGQTGTQCSGNYVQTRTCGDYDADSCLEWSSWSNTTNCDSSDGCVDTTYRNYYCSGGSCTYSSSYNDSRCCTNDCSYSGQTACCNSSSRKTCGNYDGDSCLEWSGCSSCGTDKCVGTTWVDYYCSGSSCGSTNYYNDSRCIPNPANNIPDCGEWNVYAGTPIGGSRTAQTGDLLVRADGGYVWCSACNNRDYALVCKVKSNCLTVTCNGYTTQTWSDTYATVECSGSGSSCIYCIVGKGNMSSPVVVNSLTSCPFSTGDRGDIFVKNTQCNWTDYKCSITGSNDCNIWYDGCSYYKIGSSVSRANFMPTGNTCVRK